MSGERPERSLRCVAATGWGSRCRRWGDIRVDDGLVCRQHFIVGWLPFRLPADVEIDPRIAERAAAVMED